MNITEGKPEAHVHANVQAEADDLVSALRTLKPNAQHRKHLLFSLLYPVIVELLDNKVTQKSILEVLETKGLKLHPARFKELMAAEAKSLPAGKTPSPTAAIGTKTQPIAEDEHKEAA